MFSVAAAMRLDRDNEKAAVLLNWGDVGYSQVMKAKEVICRQYGITEISNIEEWV